MDMTRRTLIGGTAACLATPLLASRPALGAGPLDGLDFEGILASTDGEHEVADSLHFRDGYFWSRGCIACKFAPGAYWTRRVGDAITFRGALESEESGTFAYEGRVEGERLSVRIDWRRERWYWTIERGFVFEGALRPGAGDPVTLDDAFLRATGERAAFCTL